MNLLATAPFPIRVLIADDSAFMREVLSRAVESAPSLQVCGTARHGVETLEKIRELQPDVVTLDIEMPELNGIEVLKRIMKDFPRPVIMVSAFTQPGAEVTAEALAIGAFDYLSKVNSGHRVDPRKLSRELVAKIEAAAQSPLIRRVESIQASMLPDLAKGNTAKKLDVVPAIIALGTSTGGPKALQEIVPELPADLPAGMIVVQHMPPGFTGPLAKRLNSISEIEVREAEHGDIVEPGRVYIARAGRHIRVERNAQSKTTISVSDQPLGTMHTPSADVLMLSVAALFGRYSLGIILTGMGVDGLQGMTAIHQAGGITIGQDEATSLVYGMPRACAEGGVLQRVIPLSQISTEITQALRYTPRN
ncbi:MAG: hypothetical protein AUG89_12120 [Acidobacteria bacterium 13_1_20CM_4_56_7]|nr:MAG: hypothetical protein AUG89_12120 [Acidobacteria bacterium 13_1_20CM_4_56_7]PYV49833.1 MAG: chemotaxis response regulator protein-glutamate methylesterase [Acidobacteriota bacterium]